MHTRYKELFFKHPVFHLHMHSLLFVHQKKKLISNTILFDFHRIENINL